MPQPREEANENDEEDEDDGCILIGKDIRPPENLLQSRKIYWGQYILMCLFYMDDNLKTEDTPLK